MNRAMFALSFTLLTSLFPFAGSAAPAHPGNRLCATREKGVKIIIRPTAMYDLIIILSSKSSLMRRSGQECPFLPVMDLFPFLPHNRLPSSLAHPKENKDSHPEYDHVHRHHFGCKAQ